MILTCTKSPFSLLLMISSLEEEDTATLYSWAIEERLVVVAASLGPRTCWLLGQTLELEMSSFTRYDHGAAFPAAI